SPRRATVLRTSHSLFLHPTSPTELYTLSLHDALPISSVRNRRHILRDVSTARGRRDQTARSACTRLAVLTRNHTEAPGCAERRRSEEHTSELQSPCNLVCRLLLEKKKNNP